MRIFALYQNIFKEERINIPSGGRRPGAGRPRKALASRLEEGIGKVSHKKPKVLDFPVNNQISNNQKSKLPTFLEMASKEGGADLPSAMDIYGQTLEWVISTGCEKFVPKQLIEDFAFTRRSYLESEYMNKKLGRLVQGGKQSPYVRTALEYLKQTTAFYREIWSIVAQNSTKDYDGKTPQDNMFLRLLAERGF